MKNYIKIILFISGILLSNIVFGQNNYTNNLYIGNMYGINPAYAGSTGGTYFGIQARSSLTGLSGAPKTGMFVLHGPLGKGVSMGVQAVADQRAAFRNTGLLVSPTYTAKLSDNTSISFGLGLGFMSRSIDLDYVDVNGYVDPTDPTLTSDIFNSTSFTGKFGMMFKHKNLEIAASLPQLLEDKKELNGNFRGMMSYKFFPGVGNLKIQPSVMYQVIPFSENQFDGNLMFGFKEVAWIQGTYRSNENIIIATGVKVNQLEFSYAFELQNGKQSDVADNSHEILVAFSIKGKEYKKTTNLSQKLKEKRDKINKANAERERINNEQMERLDDSIEKMDKALDKNKDNSKKLKDLEKEIKKLRKELGDVTVKIKNESEKITTDKGLISMDKDQNGQSQPIKKGNYVVIQTCTKQDYAEKLVGLYKAQELKAGIAFNPNKGYYYVYESYYSTDFDASIKRMKDLRAKGFDDAWVLVYDE